MGTSWLAGRSAIAPDNPNYVDVVIHSYRHRLGLAPGYPQYADVEAKLAALPVIAALTVTLDGEANAIIPASDGRSSAAKFTNIGRRMRATPYRSKRQGSSPMQSTK